MALLQKIKEKLGFGGGSSDTDGGETTVTVEHEPNDAADAAATEADASTVETGDTSVDAGNNASAVEADDASAVEADASDVDAGDDASDDDIGDTDAAEVDEYATGDDVDEMTNADDDINEATDVDEATDADDDTDETTDSAADTDEATDADDDEDVIDGTPVDQVKGIGPAYAERLGEIGIHTVEDLAGADAAAIADGTSVGEGRATTWIDRAAEF